MENMYILLGFKFGPELDSTLPYSLKLSRLAFIIVMRMMNQAKRLQDTATLSEEE